MERFYLEEPTLERKEEALEYLQEFVDYNSEINGTGGLNSCLKENTYEKWIEALPKKKEKEYSESIGKVPGSTYFMVRESDNKIIGMFNLRYYLNDYLKKYGGHIGYGVRPTERRKGYATILLYKALEKCRELGLEDVLVTCKEDNIGSAKTIEKNHGVLKETIYNQDLNCNFKKYWIHIEDALENKKRK